MVSKHKFGKDHPEVQIDAPNEESIEKHYYKYRFNCEWIKKVKSTIATSCVTIGKYPCYLYDEMMVIALQGIIMYIEYEHRNSFYRN
jgi:hypothetical protein